MTLPERYLLAGAWYAAEHCGLPLRDAALLYAGCRYGTAGGLAMLARQELVRSLTFREADSRV